ncbi:MAG: hypothetical protein JST91_22995 [Actinobacteria bacterium]|nr:hypothetical protein [Actinomycetota bacterium]
MGLRFLGVASGGDALVGVLDVVVVVEVAGAGCCEVPQAAVSAPTPMSTAAPATLITPRPVRIRFIT